MELAYTLIMVVITWLYELSKLRTVHQKEWTLLWVNAKKVRHTQNLLAAMWKTHLSVAGGAQQEETPITRLWQ